MALITAAIVVVVGVEQGIILAIVLSVIIHLRHSYRPHDQLVTETDDGPRTTGLADGAQARPGLVIYRFGANLYYANAARLSEELLALVDNADPPLRWICLSADAIGDVDYSGSATLREAHDQLAKRGVTLVLCRPAASGPGAARARRHHQAHRRGPRVPVDWRRDPRIRTPRASRPRPYLTSRPGAGRGRGATIDAISAMRRIEAEVEIGVPAERVWAVLTDFAAYPRWNPFMPEVHGEARVGAALRARLEAPHAPRLHARLRVTKVVPLRELRWTGTNGLVREERVITITPTGDGRVRFAQRTDFAGPLAPLLGFLDRYAAGDGRDERRAQGARRVAGRPFRAQRAQGPCARALRGPRARLRRHGRAAELRAGSALAARARRDASAPDPTMRCSTSPPAPGWWRVSWCAATAVAWWGSIRAPQMLAASRARLARDPALRGASSSLQGEAERLPFADGEFDHADVHLPAALRRRPGDDAARAGTRRASRRHDRLARVRGARLAAPGAMDAVHAGGSAAARPPGLARVVRGRSLPGPEHRRLLRARIR